MLRIKARLAGNGHSIVKSRNTEAEHT